jgi:hypothetical protein
MAIQPVEDATVRAFIVLARRDRYLSLLANPKRRSAILGKLAHCHDFDERYATPLPSNADVPGVLRSHGAPATCHVISEAALIDGREMEIEEAIEKAAAANAGALLCCVPGRLAFYLGESGEQRSLLRRGSPGQSSMT